MKDNEHIRTYGWTYLMSLFIVSFFIYFDVFDYRFEPEKEVCTHENCKVKFIDSFDDRYTILKNMSCMTLRKQMDDSREIDWTFSETCAKWRAKNICDTEPNNDECVCDVFEEKFSEDAFERFYEFSDIICKDLRSKQDYKLFKVWYCIIDKQILEDNTTKIIMTTDLLYKNREESCKEIEIIANESNSTIHYCGDVVLSDYENKKIVNVTWRRIESSINFRWYAEKDSEIRKLMERKICTKAHLKK